MAPTDLVVVDADAEATVDLDAAAVADDGQRFADDAAVGALVVDDDAKVAAVKVADQQVAALAGELVELAVERHVVLGAGDGGVAAERRHDAPQAGRRLQFDQCVDQVVVALRQVQFVPEALLGGHGFGQQAQPVRLRRRQKVVPLERQPLRQLHASRRRFEDDHRTPRQVQRALRVGRSASRSDGHVSAKFRAERTPRCGRFTLISSRSCRLSRSTCCRTRRSTARSSTSTSSSL